MKTHKLEPTIWHEYFDYVSQHLPASLVEIDITGFDIGYQVVVSRLAIDGLSYDPRDNEVVIIAEHFEHHIAAPREIYVVEECGQLSCIDVLDAGGHQQIVLLTAVEALPPPSSQASG
jgi:hypothetical protein